MALTGDIVTVGGKKKKRLYVGEKASRVNPVFSVKPRPSFLQQLSSPINEYIGKAFEKGRQPFLDLKQKILPSYLLLTSQKFTHTWKKRRSTRRPHTRNYEKFRILKLKGGNDRS